MITGRVLFKKTADTIEKYAPEIRARLKRDLGDFLIYLQGYVKEKKLTGQVLDVQTGTLMRSVHVFQEETPEAVSGFVATGREAPYGAVHEFGGSFVIPGHRRTITQAFGRMLESAKTITVHQHLATFPERSFMRTALRENRGKFEEMTRGSVQAVLKGARA